MRETERDDSKPKRLAAALGLLQVYNSNSHVIVDKDAVQRAMDEDAARRPPRFAFVTIVVDAVHRVSKAALRSLRSRPDDLLRRALQSDPAAQYHLAVMLETGSATVHADPEMSQLWMRRAADQRHPAAMQRLVKSLTAPSEESPPLVPMPTLPHFNSILDPFTRIWGDWRRMISFELLCAKLFPSLSPPQRPDPIPYMLDYDDDHDDDDDF